MLKNIPHKCPICQADTYIESVRCSQCNTAITNKFAISKFDKLTHEQLDFVLAFIGVEGNFKEMEKALGVSYPTVKGRLAEIQQILSLRSKNRDSTKEILEQIERGDGQCIDPEFEEKMSSYFGKFGNQHANHSHDSEDDDDHCDDHFEGEQHHWHSDRSDKKSRFNFKKLGEDISDKVNKINVASIVEGAVKLGNKGAEVADKVEKALSEIDFDIDKSLSETDFDKMFDDSFFSRRAKGSSNDGVETKNYAQTSKPFSACELHIKYTRGALTFNGMFAAETETADITKNLQYILSKRACQKVQQLVDEQFIGDYKYVFGNEILKILID